MKTDKKQETTQPQQAFADVVLVMDAHATLAFFNPSYAQLHESYTGKSPKQDEKAFFIYIEDELCEVLNNLFQQALAGIENFVFHRIAGKEFRITAYPIQYLNGKKNVLLIGRYLTEVPVEVKELFHLPSVFKNVFDHFPLPIAISDYETGEIIDINELALKKFDAKREQIIGAYSPELFYSSVTRNEYISTIDKLGKAEGMTVQLRNLKNEFIWVEIFSIPLVIEQKKRLLSVFINVTDKKEKEDKLDYSLKLLETLLNTTNIAVLVEDDNRNILHANTAFTKMFSVPMPAEQLKGINCNAMGASMVDFFADGNSFLSRVEKILHDKIPVTDELIHCTNGNILKRSYFPIELKEQRKGTLWQYEDVTISIRQQKELIRNKEELQSLVTSLDDIIFELDQNLCFVNYWCANDNMLFLPPHEFMGRTITQALGHMFNASFFTPFHQTLMDGKTRNVEYQIPLPDGSLAWFNAKLNRIKSQQQQQKKLVLTIQDISTRKKAEEDTLAALEKEKHLSELKSRFVAMTSHEFKTPLTAIKSSAELIELNLLKLQNDMSANVNRHVKIITQEVDRLTRLMNDVLILGKIEANKISYSPENTDLLALIHEVSEQLSFSQQDGRTVKVITNGNVREVFVDTSQMNHILNNLLSNALKYSPGKQEPEVTVTWSENQFEIIIRDYGIGIPESDLKNVFESFYRATNVAGINGTGLGLVLVKNFINLHRGDIEIRSKLNEGTVVTICIKDQQIKQAYEKDTHH